MGSSPITYTSVMHWVLTPRGMKRPQRTKTTGSVRPRERGIHDYQSANLQHYHRVMIPREVNQQSLLGVYKDKQSERGGALYAPLCGGACQRVIDATWCLWNLVLAKFLKENQAFLFYFCIDKSEYPYKM